MPGAQLPVASGDLVRDSEVPTIPTIRLTHPKCSRHTRRYLVSLGLG